MDSWQQIQPPALLGGANVSGVTTCLAIDDNSHLIWTGRDSGTVDSFFADGRLYTRFLNHQAVVTQVASLRDRVLSLGSDGLVCRNVRGTLSFRIGEEADITDYCALALESRTSSNVYLAGIGRAPLLFDIETLKPVATTPDAAENDACHKVDVSSLKTQQQIRTNATELSSAAASAGPPPFTMSDYLDSASAALFPTQYGGNGADFTQTMEELDYQILRSGSLLGCGRACGRIEVRDPRTIHLEHSFEAHSGYLSDFDIQGNYLLTCGFSVRNGHYVQDHIVQAYDLRAMKLLMPLTFAGSPSFIRIHPRIPHIAAVASQNGKVSFLDVNDQNNSSLFHLSNSNIISSMQISGSGDSLIFCETDNIVHIWSATTDPSICRSSTKLESATEILPPCSLDIDQCNLNDIGLPYYDKPLFSALADVPVKLSQVTPPLDSALIASATAYGNTLYSMNIYRYQPNLHVQRDPVIANESFTPKFLSESSKRDKFFEDLCKEQQSESVIPRWYHRLNIKYSKFGVEDFDFGFFNRTTFSGLETDIANSHVNSILQLLRFSGQFEPFAINHCRSSCKIEQCLLCELGFLFEMLDRCHESTCQASNFLHCLKALPEAAQRGVMFDNYDVRQQGLPIGNIVQDFLRYLLLHCAKSCKSTYRTFTELIGSVSRNITQTTCGPPFEAPQSVTFTLEIKWPELSMINTSSITFAMLLSDSMRNFFTTMAQCKNCRMVHAQQHVNNIEELPLTLLINTNISNPLQMSLWIDNKWPPIRVAFQKVDGAVSCIVCKKDRKPPQGYLQYELTGFVCEISNVDSSHLVTIVRSDPLKKVKATDKRDENTTGSASMNGASPGPQIDEMNSDLSGREWLIFNDFLVKKLSEEEALQVFRWKKPMILCYRKLDQPNVVKSTDVINTSLLYKDLNIAENRNPSKQRHKVLQADEKIDANTVVAVDSEFVSLHKENVELKSDGSRILICPERLSLARVSVIRTEGPLRGVPFIDDYVLQKEPVEDYLTEFSGILPDDLDPKRSNRTLLPLKMAYKKLKVLVDLGCKFIGHGLAKDFRIINLLPRPEQIIDSVDLFFIKERQRKLSLRFLAWILLQEDIQQETHDSIEDALTAMKLCDRYKELRAEGTFEETLKEIYQTGRLYGFKPPQSHQRGSNTMLASPLR